MTILIGDDTSATLAGTADGDILFSGFNTTIPHSMLGGAGSDVLISGLSVAGDVLNGGPGSNLMILGSFAATIDVSKHGEVDTVYGFGEGDTIRIVDPTSPHEVNSVQMGADVVLNIGGFGGQEPDHSSVVLKDVDLHDVHASIDEAGTLLMTFHHAADLNPMG